MADSPGHPPPKFPPRIAAPVLVLPRRRTSFVPPSTDVHESIKDIVETTRATFGRPEGTSNQAAELERSLRKLEASLVERERLLGEAGARLAERERDVAEMEALLLAREKLVLASRHDAASPTVMSKGEKDALEELKRTLDQQAASLQEQRNALREREQFLDESETRLFAKVQEQQEKESELEQRAEDLRTQKRQLREARAAFDPKVAAEIKAEDAAAKKRDEFNE